MEQSKKTYSYNKAQLRELDNIRTMLRSNYYDQNILDSCSRAISSLIRSAYKTSQKEGLMNFAKRWNLNTRKDFIC
jgi:hypothetical protein